MDALNPQSCFNSLSIADLLTARDQFHVHLMNKPNVVGTAIGRYLIRKDDPWPSPKTERQDEAKNTRRKPARTLENSEVRDYSWPCVLVFVSEWKHDNAFGTGRELLASGFIPSAIYMEDGRSVPICVVWAPRMESAPPGPDLSKLTFPTWQMSAGYPAIAEVQGRKHIASIGCLVTDGHRIYALTNRHVAGEKGEVLKTIVGQKKVAIGRATDRQLGKRKFEEIYPGWSGKNVYLNMDICLVDLEDETQWSPAVYGLGALGPLADLHVYNLGVQLIGRPVRAHGSVGGRMEGQIAALFYRYRSVGGFEYVADLLIGSRDESPLQTRPGDSGTLWALENDQARSGLMPVAIQWGGTVFLDRADQMPFVLATNLSSICRELDVDLFRSRNEATFEYWGVLGHYTIGALACDQIKDGMLKKLMKANRERVSFDLADIKAKVRKVKAPAFVPLADVPDKVWKALNTEKTPYGRKGLENPNHYADIDLAYKGQKSLDQQTPNAAALKTATWQQYYKAIGFNTVSQRGLLPFRVWQIYKQMVRFVGQQDVTRFVCAAGVLAHYIGDACQPLHGSYFDDGDAFRKPDGTPSPTPLPHGTAFGHGVHEAYENDMLDKNVDDLLSKLPSKLGKSHGMKLIKGGNQAGYAIIELMRRTQKTIAPKGIVKAYTDIPEKDRRATAPAVLWKAFEKQTLTVLADGCNTLAMIWESAWVEGNGKKVPQGMLTEKAPGKLQSIYEDQKFLPSVALGQVQQYL
jgi:hypothetical protein